MTEIEDRQPQKEPEMTADISLEKVARMLDGVTPGPWTIGVVAEDEASWFQVRGPADGDGWMTVIAEADNQSDARFIAWAREAVPALAARLAEVEALLKMAEAHTLLNSTIAAKNLSRAEAAEAKLAASEARVEKLRALVRVAGEARLLIDTGFSEHAGDTINYRPSVIDRVLDMLEPHTTLEGDKP